MILTLLLFYRSSITNRDNCWQYWHLFNENTQAASQRDLAERILLFYLGSRCPLQTFLHTVTHSYFLVSHRIIVKSGATDTSSYFLVWAFGWLSFILLSLSFFVSIFIPVHCAFPRSRSLSHSFLSHTLRERHCHLLEGMCKYGKKQTQQGIAWTNEHQTGQGSKPGLLVTLNIILAFNVFATICKFTSWISTVISILKICITSCIWS